MKKLFFLFSMLALLLATTFTPCQAQKKTLNSNSPTKIAQKAPTTPAPADVAPAPASTPTDAPADVSEEANADSASNQSGTEADDPTDWTTLFSYLKKVIGSKEDFNALLLLVYALITYLFAFFSAKFPVLKKINSTWERVIVSGIVVAVGFSGFVYKFDLNLMTILEQVLGFVFATKFLHPILDGQGLKTPKAETTKPTPA